MIPAAWSGSDRVLVRKVRVLDMPDCEVHPTVERAEGVLSIHWESTSQAPGHVYSCWDCAEGLLGRLAYALDNSLLCTTVQVELQVLAKPGTGLVAA